MQRGSYTRIPAFFESGLYTKSLQIKYADDVHGIYEDALNSVLESCGYSKEHIRFYIHSFADLKRVAENYMGLQWISL